MNRDYEGERFVENSSLSALRAMADNKPEDFLKLLGMERINAPLDEETTKRFKRLGLLDPMGNIQESVRKALQRVHFIFPE
jgi:hypothetical protein